MRHQNAGNTGELRPRSAEEVQAAVRESTRVLPRGGGTKGALSSAVDGATTVIEMGGLSGVLEYDPGEYTITALAGTPVREVVQRLGENGQYLPFDPPLGERGATLGGTVAAGLSGPERFRYGGVRDFLIGVRFVDGEGRLVTGGGKVVKNAAGFDFPKLLVGSLGRLGIAVELTFKVFPRSEAFITLRFDYDNFDAAARALVRLTTSPLDLQALDLEPPATLVIRSAGVAGSERGRRERVEQFLDRSAACLEDDAEYWMSVKEFDWVPEAACLVKVPLTPRRMRSLEERLQSTGAPRRYSVGGNVAWLAWPGEAPFERVESILRDLRLRALVLWGHRSGSPLVHFARHSFGARVGRALDPRQRFLELV